MSCQMLEKMSTFFDGLTGARNTAVIDLFAWGHRAFSISSTEAVYGLAKPFSHRPEVEDAFW